MGDALGYFGTLGSVVVASAFVGGLAATLAWMALWGACWFPHNWSDWRGKVRSKDDQVAEKYVITACIFWARVAFVLGVLYGLTEVCRDEVQRLLSPLLGFVNGL